jgi:hypothetical protein
MRHRRDHRRRLFHLGAGGGAALVAAATVTALVWSGALPGSGSPLAGSKDGGAGSVVDAGMVNPCGPDTFVLEPATASRPTLCAHIDEPPAGVDVHRPVATAELQARTGASAEVIEAANDAQVPTPATYASTSEVRCDGDGTSGYRVQALYVVEAGQPNRFSTLLPSLKLWAAGVDDVINRSAALTGGVRNPRFVTTGTTACTPSILNVTVPAGTLGSFNSSISALQSLGYTRADRKYLYWADAAVLCGVAAMYLDDRMDQSNNNNGRYAQYARVDSGCWGRADHSTEAHELVHTLGGVQGGAPHATAYGHCWDESDLMCYSDGDPHAMVQVCPPTMEPMLDCNADDYFSTRPTAGSWLASHWNAADNQFLIGAGVTGAPLTTSATASVNSPAIAGLHTQAQVAVELPAGRTLSSVAWTASRADCVFSDRTAEQTDVTCPAVTVTPVKLTAKVTDSTGATASSVTTLAFTAAGATRAVTLDLRLDTQTGAASLCPSGKTFASVTANDTQTGEPILGLAATVTKKLGTATTTASAGRVVSGIDPLVKRGLTLATPPSGTLAVGASTPVVGAFRATTVPAVVGTVQSSACVPTVQLAALPAVVYSGDPLSVTGTLTRAAGSQQVPLTGATVGVLNATGTRVASAVSLAGGAFEVKVRMTAPVDVSLAVPATVAYAALTAPLGHVDYALATTRLSVTEAPYVVGVGGSLEVKGDLVRVMGAGERPVTGASVALKVTPAGATGPTTLGSGRVLADGTFTVTVKPKVSGPLTLVYLGATGQPAASAPAGTLTVKTWTTKITGVSVAYLTASSRVVSGTVTRSVGAGDVPAPGIRVQLWLTSALGTKQLTTTTTRTDGTFRVTTSIPAGGQLTAKVAAVVGHTDSASSPVAT